jgi:hypothetical protein
MQTRDIEKEFIPYEQALALKELGFDEPCFGYFEPNSNLKYVESHIVKDFSYLAKNSEWQDLVAAPLYQQAFRFFREEYELHGEPFSQKRPADNFKYAFKISGKDIMYDGYDTYEEAELECLKELIEVVKNGKH